MRTLSSRLVGAFASSCFASLLLVAQAPAQQSPAAIPDWIMYGALFQDLDNQEAFANSLQARGHEHTRMRGQIRAKIGLTVEEDLFLKSIAHAALQQQLQARLQVDEIRGRYPKEKWVNRTVPPEEAAKIGALRKREKDVVMEMVARYRERFGGERFSVLDRYVRNTVAPTIAMSSVVGNKQ